MSHKSKRHHKKKKKTHKPLPASEKRLELVVKGDTDGCEDAVCGALLKNTEGVDIDIIRKGVGNICKNDVLAAANGSKLVVGFNVDALPKISDLCREQNVEIRLYSVIYTLQEDIKEIAKSLVARQEATEEITGTAKVIALFKGSRKGIILGCEVGEGRLQKGDAFRVISGMGPIYTGIIESLHIEKDTVNQATTGRQVGVKIENFNKAKVGDLVECYKKVKPHSQKSWQPSGKILQRK